ncbi:MAG TPA: hypothetical protein PLU35_13575 [Phycisphaerales bacterium]|nr:hypothetical protein [Phycisphaerales bacterium]
MIPWLLLTLVAVLLCSPALAQGDAEVQQLAQDGGVPSRIGLADQIRKQWPSEGSVFISFINGRNDKVAAYDFATGAFYRIWRWEQITLREPDGSVWSGAPTIDGLRRYDDPWTRRAAEWVLDDYFPQLPVVRALEMAEVPVRIDRSEDGGLFVRVMLPRGAWSPGADLLSDFEIERWGGPGRVDREVVYALRSDLTVSSKTYPASHLPGKPLETKEYDVDARSPQGFQVVATDSGVDAMKLSSISFDAQGSSGGFSREAALNVAISHRVAQRERVPVVTAAEADANPQNRPVPLRGDRPPALSLRTGLMGAGAVLVAIGLLAWFRMRRG